MRKDYYGRELMVDELTGDVIPTLWLGDIKFRRWDLITRSPAKQLETITEHLDDLLNNHLYSQPDEFGGRTINESAELPHILAAIATEVDNLKKLNERIKNDAQLG